MSVSLVSDTGIASNDAITSNPRIAGGGDSNATVTISEGSIGLGTTTANAAGLWSFTPSGLVDGTHTLTVSETNLNGTGTTAITFALDQGAPTIAIISAGGLTNQPTQTITGTVSEPNLPANATIALFDNGGLIGTTSATNGLGAHRSH